MTDWQNKIHAKICLLKVLHFFFFGAGDCHSINQLKIDIKIGNWKKIGVY